MRYLHYPSWHDHPQVKQNPSQPRYVPNPGWATDMITRSMGTIEQHVPSQWLPKVRNIVALDDEDLVAANLSAYGCGSYGCVYPTYDPQVVMKVTEDDTEAQFATTLSQLITRPICVKYYFGLLLDEKHKGHAVNLLWRESAQNIGEIGNLLGDHAVAMIRKQHQAAQEMYRAIYLHSDIDEIEPLVRTWLNTCEEMARQTSVPELRALGDGLVETYADHRIVFGDIHAFNLGVVQREDGGHWVITDPGHVAVIENY